MPVGDTIRLAVVEETFAARDVILRIVSKRTEGGVGFVTYELEQPDDSAVGDAVKAQALVQTGDGLFRHEQVEVLALGETVEGEVSTSLDGSAATFTFALEVGAFGDTLIGQPSSADRIEVTVSRSVENLPEVPVPSPPEPVDEETATAFELPFTPFNDSPLFSGFQNPVIDVPQKGDIQDVIGAQGLSLRAITQNLNDGLQQLNDPTADAVAQAVTGSISFPEVPEPPSPGDIGTEVLDVFDDAIEATERGFVDVLQGAEDAAEATEDTLTETVEPALDAIEPTVDSIETAVNDLPEDIATTGDLAFSSLQDDVAQLQTDIENLSLDVPEPDFPEVPTVEDITGAIEDELVPTVEDVSLLDDPIGFFDVAVEGVLEDLLSNDSQRDILRASRRRR
jgi:hypothetical protein